MNEKRQHTPITLRSTNDLLQVTAIPRREKHVLFMPHEHITVNYWERINAHIQDSGAPLTLSWGAERLKMYFQTTSISPENIQPLPPLTKDDRNLVHTLVLRLQDLLTKGPMMFDAYGSDYLETAMHCKMVLPAIFPTELLTEALFTDLTAAASLDTNITSIFSVRQLFLDKSPEEIGVTTTDLPKYLARLNLVEGQVDLFASEAAYLRLLYPTLDITTIVNASMWEHLYEKFAAFREEKEDHRVIGLAFAMTILSAEKVTMAKDGSISLQMPLSHAPTAPLPILRTF